MCLSTPAKIKSISNDILRVKINQDERLVKSALTKPKVGDWVLVNADLAYDKISEKEAQEINKLIK